MDETAINVLLIDDDEDDYLLTRGYLAKLEGQRYHLTWCSTFEAGLEALHRAEHDVYLVDYHLGERVGLELLREARETVAKHPVIMLTGLSDREVDSLAIREGAADYLVKDQITAPLLERSIRHAVERNRIKLELSASEERYALAAQGANDGLWDWDLTSGEVYYSPRWKAMVGLEDTDITDSTIDVWLSRLHPDDVERVRDRMRQHLAATGSHVECEYRLRFENGSYRWMLSRALSLRNADGEVYRITGWQTDLSERTASYDALTSLPNRSLFLDRVARCLAQTPQQPGYDFAVLFLDLDGFKFVNDSLGHTAGDSLLIEVAARLERVLRSSDTVTRLETGGETGVSKDTVARFGGDEFALLVDEVGSAADAGSIAERVQRALAQPFRLEGRDLFVSASVGVALGSAGYQNAEEMLRDADTAMYWAKDAGKDRYALFDEEMHAYVQTRLSLEADLRRAVEREEFRLVYQPIVSLESGQVEGLEALLRWQHPERGLLSPDSFIDIAESSGLIIPIGRWVLETACRQLRAWQKRFETSDLYVNVNLSGKQLTQTDLAEQVETVLNDTGLDPASLKLEVTESMMLENTALVVQTLEWCRQLGIRVQVDDFGTGYSSLSRLHSLPVDGLKIDRSFVNNLSQPEGKGIVQVIQTLAQTLNLGVVAEGIETGDQAAVLKMLGCSLGQGYHFYRPLEPKVVEGLLEREDNKVDAADLEAVAVH